LRRIQHHLSLAVSRLLRGITATLIVALVLLMLAQHAGSVGPWWLELSRYLPFTALLAPAGAALALSYWLGWRWRLASAATLALVATLGMGLAWGRADDGELPLRFMTYNIKAHLASERPDGYAELAAEIARHDPDLLVAQDNRGAGRVRASEGWPGGLGYGLPHVFTSGQFMIASRHPLRDCTERVVVEPGRERRYALCTVDAHGVALRVATAHFESPRGGLVAARREGLDGADTWARNYEQRLDEARLLARELRGSPRPLIVAGDLNAPESSAVVRALLDIGLRDAFSSAGRGYGYTYGQAMRSRMSLGLAFSFLRIDHILVGPEIGVVDARVGNGSASEHRPVVADLLLRRR
jgi:vancomycin resistance protein VanJ